MSATLRPYKGPTLAIPNVFLYRLLPTGQSVFLAPDVNALTGTKGLGAFEICTDTGLHRWESCISYPNNLYLDSTGYTLIGDSICPQSLP